MHQNTPFQVKNIYFLGRGYNPSSVERGTFTHTLPIAPPSLLDPSCVPQNFSEIYAIGCGTLRHVLHDTRRLWRCSRQLALFQFTERRVSRSRTCSVVYRSSVMDVRFSDVAAHPSRHKRTVNSMFVGRLLQLPPHIRRHGLNMCSLCRHVRHSYHYTSTRMTQYQCLCASCRYSNASLGIAFHLVSWYCIYARTKVVRESYRHLMKLAMCKLQLDVCYLS